MSNLFSPIDFEEAHEKHGAMCGHGALAAALGIPVCEAMKHLSKPGWINLPMMEKALKHAGYAYRVIPGQPGQENQHLMSIVFVQYLGPWMNDRREQCKYRHWIAVTQGQARDINVERWIYTAEWTKEVITALLSDEPESTGWECYRTNLLGAKVPVETTLFDVAGVTK